MKCVYCGITDKDWDLFETDHFVPSWYLERHGSVAPVTVNACSMCNNQKGGRIFSSIDEARKWLRCRIFLRDTPGYYSRFKDFPSCPSDDDFLEYAFILSTITQRTRFAKMEPSTLERPDCYWASN